MNPLEFADKYSIEYAIKTNTNHKKQFGQYLTPPIVAQLMSDCIRKNDKEAITILDPGIGTAILSISACIKLAEISPNIKRIMLFGYEIDSDIIPFTRINLNYLKKWLEENKIYLSFEIRNKDFVLDNAYVFSDSGDLFKTKELFDIIISNPPYFKINKNDKHARVAKQIIYGQPNIYSIFMAISAKLLNENGDLIYITPRSYTSGFYFKEFRKEFFNIIKPIKFHLFDSRKEAFDRDAILQEHLIIHGTTKSTSKQDINVQITFSQGVKDLDSLQIRDTKLVNIINFESENLSIFLPTSKNEEDIISKILSWEGSLHKYGMQISTGRVVPFRAKEYLCKCQNENFTIPLIWLNHIRNKSVEWPIKNFRKDQYFIISENSRKLTNKKDNFVLLRRFSAKEEKRRLNAAPFFEDSIKEPYVAIENHVNYIYKLNGSLTLEETLGLSEIFNSKILDIYFRTHNGNTEVSATEIRDMPLPELKTIKTIGEKKIKDDITPEEVDSFLLHSS